MQDSKRENNLFKISTKVRNYVIISALTILLIIGYYILIYNKPIPERPKDFEIIFKYGVNAENVLDTYTDTFTKYSFNKPPVTFQLFLTEKELDTIWIYINRYHFYDLSSQEVAEPETSVPVKRVILFVHGEGYEDKEINRRQYKSFNYFENQFFIMAEKIQKLIESKPEYQAQMIK
jgi:hypothetical protein